MPAVVLGPYLGFLDIHDVAVHLCIVQAVRIRAEHLLEQALSVIELCSHTRSRWHTRQALVTLHVAVNPDDATTHRAASTGTWRGGPAQRWRWGSGAARPRSAWSTRHVASAPPGARTRRTPATPNASAVRRRQAAGYRAPDDNRAQCTVSSTCKRAQHTSTWRHTSSLDRHSDARSIHADQLRGYALTASASAARASTLAP